MCGWLIAVGLGPISHETLGPLRRRGPDGIGFWTDGRVTIAHARLAIVGVDAAGTEPLSRGRFVIAWNGEAYNYDRRCHTDAHWLLEGPREVEGFGALAVYDRVSGAIRLERDALGVKPLYFWADGERFAASSMIQPLLDLGCPRDLDMTAIGQYARYQLTWGGRTFFRHIRKVEPGERLTREADGTWGIELRDDVWHQTDDKVPDERWIEETRELLVRCVHEATVGDVPFTTTCSGGLDSSAVTAILRPGRAYHANFSDPDCNETRYAKLVGVPLMVTNARQHEGQGLIDALRSLVEDFDELGVGSVILPLDDLFAQVKRRYKVVVTGTGGDELFAGYARYALAHGREVPGYEKHQGDWHEKGGAGWYRFETPQRPPSDPLDFDRRVFLPALLNIEDKIGGRHGIEARPALLHQKLVRRIMTLDQDKLVQDELKWLGKILMRGIIPDAIVDRADKKGFPTPIGKMVNSASSAIRDQIMTSRFRKMYDLGKVRFTAQGPWSRETFGLLLLDLWLNRYA